MRPSESSRLALLVPAGIVNGDAWQGIMDVGIPKLATPEELAAFKAPTLLICGDQDVSFPRDKLVKRARELFPSLAGTEVIPNCKHCPPTTDEFRGWLGGRLHGFLGGQASAAVAS